MFIGHFGVGFAAKKLAPRAPLGWLLMGCQLVDLMWPALVLAGAEKVEIEPGATQVTPLDFAYYPYTHSLVAGAIWALAFGLLGQRVLRDRRSGIVLGLLVLSHWFLDLIVHRPDLPLTPFGSDRVGLGLWNSIPGTLTIESILFFGGAWIYMHATKPKDRTGSIALAALIAFLVLVNFANFFGPPPPNPTAIGMVGLLTWLFPIWGFWIDRHRVNA